jgi:EpsI family protein
MTGNQIRYAAVMLLLISTAAFLQGRSELETRPEAKPLSTLPATIGPWLSLDQPIPSDIRDVLGPGDFLKRYYYRDDDRVGIDFFVAYFPSQKTGDTIHSPRHCLPGAGWQFASIHSVPLHLPGMKAIRANESILIKGNDKLFALFWYQAHGRGVASEYWAKFYLVADAIRMNRTDGALVRFITPIRPEESIADARRRTLELASAVSPRLHEYIPEQ